MSWRQLYGSLQVDWCSLSLGLEWKLTFSSPVFVVILPKAHMDLHSRMSVSRWVITTSWLSGSWRSFLYSSSVYSCHLFLITFASVRSTLFLSYIVSVSAWNVPFSSVESLSCVWLFATMNRSMPSLHVHHQIPEFTQTRVHGVGDAIQPSHPLSSTSPPAPNRSQHQGLFQWVNSSDEVAKKLEFHHQHQSFQWTPRTDLL